MFEVPKMIVFFSTIIQYAGRYRARSCNTQAKNKCVLRSALLILLLQSGMGYRFLCFRSFNITKLIFDFGSGKFHFRLVIGAKKTNEYYQSVVFIVPQRAIKSVLINASACSTLVAMPKVKLKCLGILLNLLSVTGRQVLRAHAFFQFNIAAERFNKD